MPVPIYLLIAALCGKLKKTRQDWSVTVSNQFIHRRETYGYGIKTNLYRSLDVRWIWLSGLPLACCVHELMRPASWSWLPVGRSGAVGLCVCVLPAVGAKLHGSWKDGHREFPSFDDAWAQGKRTHRLKLWKLISPKPNTFNVYVYMGWGVGSRCRTRGGWIVLSKTNCAG